MKLGRRVYHLRGDRFNTIKYTFFRFSCDIVQVDNYGWNINGTFNGVMGLFQQKRIQMLSHATIMREDRLAAVEFTAEVFVIE